jgi:fatty-acyl-CoA synthase
MEVPLSPLALVARGLRLYPERPAVLDDGRLLSYQEFGSRLELLSGALLRQGVERGDRVALLAPNTLEALECYTAVPRAGAVLVPLNTRLGPDEYRYILGHSGSRLLLLDISLYPRVADVLGELPDLQVIVQRGELPGCESYDELLARGPAVPFDPEAIAEDAVLSLNYTSGTTARPKGVRLTHRNAYVNTVNMLLAMHLRAADVHLHVAPMFHANGWGFVWAPLAVGAANVPLPAVDPADTLRRVRAYGVTTLCAAPTVLTMILQGATTERAPQGLRVATAGAAPPAAVIRRVEEELGWTIQHFYGLTETTAFITYNEPPEGIADWPLLARAGFKARQGVDLPLSGQVRVVREDMTDVRLDGREMGEVVARGNVVMDGYYRDPEATRRAFEGGWFHTGDLAVRHPDGYIELRDRAKDMIISGGENIPSLEVEGALYRHPAVAQAAVVAAPHPHWGETPVAFVALRPGRRATADELIGHCRDLLTHFKVPSRIVFVDELPRTASGKIQKFLLRELAKNQGG